MNKLAGSPQGGSLVGKGGAAREAHARAPRGAGLAVADAGKAASPLFRKIDRHAVLDILRGFLGRDLAREDTDFLLL